VIKLALAFAAGAVVGGWVVKQLAIKRAEDAVGGAVDSILGKGSAYGGPIKTFANMFIEGN
jgi:hypothetical protein